ncbi:hypothetical protein B0H10DRAFT_974035 [Mycena sp. CBHHK59/15]|nr:hypothetical protein B0H10DRAFT_974035 [Mycena sp. CBHHK59/15]
MIVLGKMRAARAAGRVRRRAARGTAGARTWGAGEGVQCGGVRGRRGRRAACAAGRVTATTTRGRRRPAGEWRRRAACARSQCRGRCHHRCAHTGCARPRPTPPSPPWLPAAPSSAVALPRRMLLLPFACPCSFAPTALILARWFLGCTFCVLVVVVAIAGGCFSGARPLLGHVLLSMSKHAAWHHRPHTSHAIENPSSSPDLHRHWHRIAPSSLLPLCAVRASALPPPPPPPSQERAASPAGCACVLVRV